MEMNINNNVRRKHYGKKLGILSEELEELENQFSSTMSGENRRKLERAIEFKIIEIERLENQIKDLDNKNESPNLRELDLQERLQKIDFAKAKDITKSVNTKFGRNSGAVVLFLQRSTKQKGCYCIKEVLDLFLGDRKIGEEISGDFRRYLIDLSSAISTRDETEFSRTLASHLGGNIENPLYDTVKQLCLSLQGGSILFIEICNWDDITGQNNFLDWFMDKFWKMVISELEIIFQEFSKIRFIVVLRSNAKIFEKSYPSYFCKLSRNYKLTKFDPGQIIELPLLDWEVEDIKEWLIDNFGLSNDKSLEFARKIYQEGEGTPETICGILERDREKFK
jgi:hypothetical protein